MKLLSLLLAISTFSISAAAFAKGSFTGPCAQGAAEWARKHGRGVTVESADLTKDGSYFLAITVIAEDGSIDEAAVSVSAAAACKLQPKK